MGNLLFSPSGRIGSSEFYRGGFILILIGTAFSMTKMISPGLGVMFGLLSYFLAYPWVVIWIKRLHNGGKSGWLVLLYGLLYTVILMVAAMIVLIAFSGPEFMELIKAQAEGDLSQAEYMRQSQEMGASLAPKLALPVAIVGILASLLTLFIGDKATPNDEGDNQFGPGAGTFD